MITDLLRYVSNMPTKLIPRSNMVDELDLISSDIRLSLLPMMATVKTLADQDDASLATIKFLKGSEVAKKYKTLSRYLRHLTRVIDEVVNNMDVMSDRINEMPKIVSNLGLTTDQALTINVLDNMRFLVSYTCDILLLIVESNGSVKESVYTTAVLKEKKISLYDYYTILSSYDKYENILVGLDSLVIGKETKIVESLLDTRAISIVDRNFIGSPVFHFRLLWIDSDVAKIKVLTEKKEYVEMLLAEIELRQNNEYSPELDKNIENAKDIINEYEDKIEKLSS